MRTQGQGSNGGPVSVECILPQSMLLLHKVDFPFLWLNASVFYLFTVKSLFSFTIKN